MEGGFYETIFDEIFFYKIHFLIFIHKDFPYVKRIKKIGLFSKKNLGFSKKSIDMPKIPGYNPADVKDRPNKNKAESLFLFLPSLVGGFLRPIVCLHLYLKSSKTFPE